VTVIDLILQEIQKKVDRTQEDLGFNSAKDYAEYRYICGNINGLLAVKQYIEEIKSNLEND
jgi:hypothetical protein